MLGTSVLWPQPVGGRCAIFGNLSLGRQMFVVATPLKARASGAMLRHAVGLRGPETICAANDEPNRPVDLR